jgi:hypothetical protein
MLVKKHPEKRLTDGWKKRGVVWDVVVDGEKS